MTPEEYVGLLVSGIAIFLFGMIALWDWLRRKPFEGLRNLRRAKMSRRREGEKKITIKKKLAIFRVKCDQCKETFKFERCWKVGWYSWECDYDGWSYHRKDVKVYCKECAPDKEMINAYWSKSDHPNEECFPRVEIRSKKEKEKEVQENKELVDEVIDYLLDNPNQGVKDFKKKFQLG